MSKHETPYQLQMRIFISLFALLLSFSSVFAQKYEYKIITSIESIVPGGLGRSRLIEPTEERDHEDFTTERTDENRQRNSSDRSKIRMKNFEETKLLNFYTLVGIRFENVAANDAVVSSKINAMVEEGWDLAFVTSAVESDAGETDSQGIFLTRYIFKRLKE